jgi:UDP-glucose 4-epimerase
MNVYGPRQDYQGAYIAVIMKMLDAIDRGEGPTILGDGSEAFDFVSVLDCARANICAMSADAVGRYYNVGTGTRTSLRQLAQYLLDLTGSNQAIQYKENSKATLVRNRVGSTARAAKEIGFKAEIELRAGLQSLIEWRADHQAEVRRRRAKSVA